jgi:hypothetical protein
MQSKQTPSGTMKSLPGFTPEIDANIVFGGDWLYFDPDKSHARINFKGIAKYVLSRASHFLKPVKR